MKNQKWNWKKNLTKITTGLLTMSLLLLAPEMSAFAIPAVLPPTALSEISVPASPVEAVKMLRELEIQKKTEQTAEKEEAPEHDIPEEAESETPDPRRAVLDAYENLGVVKGVHNYLNLRNAPSTDAEIVGIILKNGGAEVLEDNGNGWYKVSSGGVTGYVAEQYLATGEEAEQLAVENAKLRLTVSAERLNVREAPGLNAAVFTQIVSGERYDVAEVLEGWYKIDFGMGDDGAEVVGYVSQDYAWSGYYLDEAVNFQMSDQVSEQRRGIVEFALQYLGGAYVWGGTELGVGVDCSGFMLRVFEHFGVRLSRNSYTQINDGYEISKEQLRPGDLVFFRTRGDGNISHVGLYIGSGMMIHAADPARGIILSRYDYRTPAGFRNVIKD